MNEQNKPNVTVIFQEVKPSSPGAMEVFLTVCGAITVLAFFVGGCHL